jgi:formate dehydrogenase maturation protein FdhE
VRWLPDLNRALNTTVSENISEPPPGPPKSAWPKAVAVIGVFALIVGGGVFLARELMHAPARVIEQTANLIEKSGTRLRTVAEAFHTGTVRTEFLSQAVEVTGVSRFQFAILKQHEVFKREEAGSTAWGLLPLPKVVVEAQAPVEYGYYLDFAAAWEFLREDDTVLVFAPPIAANTPALDVSALNFYTLEGSIWRDEEAVKEKLRQSLTGSLQERALQNTALVRELGRKRLADFVEKWLAEKFSDGQRFHVKVIFPDERVAVPDSKSL